MTTIGFARAVPPLTQVHGEVMYGSARSVAALAFPASHLPCRHQSRRTISQNEAQYATDASTSRRDMQFSGFPRPPVTMQQPGHLGPPWHHPGPFHFGHFTEYVPPFVQPGFQEYLGPTAQPGFANPRPCGQPGPHGHHQGFPLRGQPGPHGGYPPGHRGQPPDQMGPRPGVAQGFPPPNHGERLRGCDTGWKCE